jgi:hypothetical protein
MEKGRGLGERHDPFAGAAGQVKDVMEASQIVLFWQDASSRLCQHLALLKQTDQLAHVFLIGKISTLTHGSSLP